MRKSCKILTNAILIFCLNLSLSPQAKADIPPIETIGNLDFGHAKLALALGVVAAGAVAVAIVVYTTKGKKTITGCVVSTGDRIALTTDNDKRTYTLSGFSGIVPGDRMTLKVKKTKTKDAGNTTIWAPTKVVKDLGACTP